MARRFSSPTASRATARGRSLPSSRSRAIHRIIAFDQRGHGDSTPIRDLSLYEPAAMAADSAEILDAFGIERAIIGGESMERPRP